MFKRRHNFLLLALDLNFWQYYVKTHSGFIKMGSLIITKSLPDYNNQQKSVFSDNYFILEQSILPWSHPTHSLKISWLQLRSILNSTMRLMNGNLLFGVFECIAGAGFADADAVIYNKRLPKPIHLDAIHLAWHLMRFKLHRTVYKS